MFHTILAMNNSTPPPLSHSPTRLPLSFLNSPFCYNQMCTFLLGSHRHPQHCSLVCP